MRTIKFRAWQKYHEKMLEVTGITLDDYGKLESVYTLHPYQAPKRIVYSKWRDDFWLYDKEGESSLELMQYIGLKDKNGREIYEGDILLLHQFLFDGHEFENELIGEVVYDQEICSFVLRNIRNADVKKYMGYREHEDCGNIPIFNFYGLHEESFEKLGNIYENPELLEEGGE